MHATTGRKQAALRSEKNSRIKGVPSREPTILLPVMDDATGIGLRQYGKLRSSEAKDLLFDLGEVAYYIMGVLVVSNLLRFHRKRVANI